MLLRSSLYGETNEIVGEFMKRYSLIKLDIICHTVVNIYETFYSSLKVAINNKNDRLQLSIQDT